MLPRRKEFTSMLTRFVIPNNIGRIPYASGLLRSVNQSIPSVASEGTGIAIIF